MLQGRDIIWFIENEAAVASLIRGAAKPEDVGRLAAAAHVMFLRLKCRVWFEWIDTDSNTADGLSRLGVTDPWTVAQGWPLSTAEVADWDELYDSCQPLAHDAGGAFTDVA